MTRRPLGAVGEVEFPSPSERHRLRLVGEDDDSRGGIPAAATPGDVLVLDDCRQTLVVIRSLARAGYGVVVANEGNDGRREFTELSSSISRVWNVPGDGDAERFCDALIAYLQGAGRGVKYVFPVGEVSLKNLAAGAARLERLVTLVMPKPETLLLCMDKRWIYERAEALGIPVSPWSTGEDRAQWRRRAVEFGLPVVFKRKDSSDRVQGRKAVIIGDESALENFLRTVDDDADPASLLMQKYVAGFRHNCHVTAVDGKVTALLVTKTVRTDMPDATGCGVEVVTVAASEDLRRHCEALLEDLRYTGVCTIQFLVDPANPTPYLLEINPRLDANAGLPMFAGYDFPRMAIECASYAGDGPLPGSTTSPAYPIGMRAYWFYGDLAGLREHRLRLPSLELLKWAGRIVRALLTHSHHMTWRWNDPLPTAFLYYSMAISIARGPPRKLARTLRAAWVTRHRESREGW